MSNQYRINENVLLLLNYELSTRKNFFVYYQNNNKQFVVENQNLFNNSNNVNEIIEKTVWNNTQKINKVFNSLPILNNTTDYDLISNEKILTGSLLIRQGFNWKDIFGLLLVIKKMGNQLNETILISQLFDINNFSFNFDDSKELINGSFWTKKINFCLPYFSEQLMVSVETINFNDVISSGNLLGKINNYPINIDNFEPLINEEPIPFYIQTNVTLSNNQYLNIEPITLEDNKTIEKSIYDYFGLSEDYVVPITVEHLIKYGEQYFGYKTIRISNEDYKYGKITIGLNLTEFNSQTIDIFVSTEIMCNNKLIKREQSLIFDYSNVLSNVISNLIINPNTIYPVEIKNITNINNTVIETKTENKIIPIYQTIFSEIIKEDILFENKNISFDEIKISSFLITQTSEKKDIDFILSKNTIDGKIYYDLNNIKKPLENGFYKIVDGTNNKLLKSGKLLID